ncbi:MAG: hypothetical protein IT214_02800 [Chitinophagaceae bacterium]|jgi:hypothetical protein|nr:hypothetical protein [Chitinophagaceae bacterium]OQY94810.1 MAG: hypothetical protein B6D37_07325 [Sphingobacteriales bacterium UTBCD1]
MKLFLLDGGGAFLLIPILILFLAIIILVEGVILILFKIEKPGKAFLYSLVVNLASLGVGFLTAPLIRQIGSGISTPGLTFRWLVIFALTVLVEGFLLILLTKKRPREKVWLATLVMNLVSYIILILVFGRDIFWG